MKMALKNGILMENFTEKMVQLLKIIMTTNTGISTGKSIEKMDQLLRIKMAIKNGGLMEDSRKAIIIAGNHDKT